MEFQIGSAIISQHILSFIFIASLSVLEACLTIKCKYVGFVWLVFF